MRNAILGNDLKDVRANCFRTSLLRTQITYHVIDRARAKYKGKQW